MKTLIIAPIVVLIISWIMLTQILEDRKQIVALSLQVEEQKQHLNILGSLIKELDYEGSVLTEAISQINEQ